MKEGNLIPNLKPTDLGKSGAVNESDQLRLSDLQRQVLSSLLYYEIFSYPLQADEIRNHLSVSLDSSALLLELNALIKTGFLFECKGYYSTQDQPEWVEERIVRGERAKRFIKIAYRMGRWIASFPFVKGVYVSGSLSKKWVTEDGDIDYFIITKTGRLWIARTLLVLFKKVFLFNSHKYFCVNYFVDEDHLEIEEKNRFTATEIVTLLPIAGKSAFKDFLAANDWVKQHFPHYPEAELDPVLKIPKRSFGKALQVLMPGKLGDWVDRRFLKLTLSVWKKKFNHLEADHFEVALKSRQYVSKHHPNHFQERVLSAYQQKLSTFEAQHELAAGTLTDIS